MRRWAAFLPEGRLITGVSSLGPCNYPLYPALPPPHPSSPCASPSIPLYSRPALLCFCLGGLRARPPPPPCPLIHLSPQLVQRSDSPSPPPGHSSVLSHCSSNWLLLTHAHTDGHLETTQRTNTAPCIIICPPPFCTFLHFVILWMQTGFYVMDMQNNKIVHLCAS